MRPSTRGALLTLLVGVLLATPAAAAGNRKVIRVVLVPERNIFEQERKYRSLCDYACEQMPMNVRFEVLKGCREVLMALADGKADAGFLGSFVGAYGMDKFGLIPLLRPEWADGESYYSSYVFKRKEVPATREISTWRGLSMVFASPHTSAGYFYPLALLRSEGIEEPGDFFSTITFSGSHDAAIWMVANGMADLGAVKNTIYEELSRRKPEMMANLEVLYTGGRFPDSTLMVTPAMTTEVREAMRTVFLRMGSQDQGLEVLRQFGARRFVAAATEDFGEVRKVVADSGHRLSDLQVLERREGSPP
ncbi:MAG: phosphate/phosphite/phosphonate ABC transporter substrate-binding protein [bacterium]|nr:MAG: phosphate/phosphite/phosphonate ABC transporter substrate-binding protein [bacterium]